jgi:thiamine biosynthesis protein ThiS
MRIKLNGKPYALEKSINIGELTEILQLEPTQYAVERNCEIIPRSLYETVMLQPGDEVEIVAFIGGG